MIHNQDSTLFSTIDSKKIKIAKKNRKVNVSNLNKKHRPSQVTEYQPDSGINLMNWKDFDKATLKNFLKIKRKSLASDSLQMK